MPRYHRGKRDFTKKSFWREMILLTLLFSLSACSVKAAIDEDGLCSIYAFVPSSPSDNKTFHHMAGAMMAMEDFNARNTSFVKELANFRNCNVQFNIPKSKFFATDAQNHDAIQMLYKETTPCAVAGPFYDKPALELSAMATAAEFPLVAHRAFNRRLTSPDHHPFTSLVYPDMRGTISILIQVLERHKRYDFINFIYPFSEAGFQRREKLKSALDQKGIRFNSYSYLEAPRDPEDPRNITLAMKRMKSDGFRTILVAMDSPLDELPLLANAAEALQMNNGDYLWVWFGEYDRSFHYPPKASDPKNANITKLLSGSAWLLPFERIYPGDDFNMHWVSQGSRFVDRLNEFNPIEEGQEGYFVAEPDFFQKVGPEYGTGFMYDAVMAIGMGACLSQNKSSGMAHVDGIHDVDFLGASGRLNIERGQTHARESGFVSWLVFNVMPPKPDGTPTFGEEFTDIYLVGTETNTRNKTNPEGEWLQLPAAFSYATGASEGPPLRDETEKNYLDSGYRIFGLVLMCTALVTALATVVWVFIHRKHQVLRAAQPYFLYLVALGSTCYAIAIPFLSHDESYGWSPESLGRACMAVPWLLCMGHIVTYGALFSKLWRVNRVLQATRQKVEYHHVVWPFAIMFVSVLIILIVWTAVDSLEWVRREDPITGESIGECDCEHPWAFVAPLIALMLTASLLTAFMAYKTRDVDDAYSESSYIFILIVVELEMILIATPIMVILYDVSTSGRYIAFSITLWFFAMAQLLLIMTPKVMAYHKAVSNKSGERTRVRGGAHGEVRVTGLENDRPKGGLLRKVSSVFGRKRSQANVQEGGGCQNTTRAQARTEISTQVDSQHVG